MIQRYIMVAYDDDDNDDAANLRTSGTNKHDVAC